MYTIFGLFYYPSKTFIRDLILGLFYNQSKTFIRDLILMYYYFTLCIIILRARHDHNKIAPCGMIKAFWIELNWILNTRQLTNNERERERDRQREREMWTQPLHGMYSRTSSHRLIWPESCDPLFLSTVYTVSSNHRQKTKGIPCLYAHVRDAANMRVCVFVCVALCLCVFMRVCVRACVRACL